MKPQIINLATGEGETERLKAVFGKLGLMAKESNAYIIDFSKVKAINSGVLCMLMRLHKDLEAIGSSICIASPSQVVRDMLDNSQVSQIIRVCDSLEAAKRAVAEY